MSNLSSGTFTIVAKATDNLGAMTTSAPVTFTVNANQPSVINVTSFVNNSTVTGTSVTINVKATDPDGSITLVEFLDGTTVIGTSTTRPFTYEWNNPGEGTHVITVRVTDSNEGVTTSSPVTVNVTATGLLSSKNYGLFTGIYPNPSDEAFKVKSNRKIKHLWIKNIYGEQVEEMDNINIDQQVEIGQDLSEGPYLLIVEFASGNIEVSKLVKIK